MSLRVVLADDHVVLRQGVRALLERHGVEVVAEASDGRAAVELARQHEPDVAVVDIMMPLLNGIDAARQIVEARPGIQVVMLTALEQERLVTEAVRAGVRGFVLKTQAGEDLAQAIQQVSRGGFYVGAGVSQAVVDACRAAAVDDLGRLTSRERPAAQLVAGGQTTHPGAALLATTPQTPRFHRGRVMKKLNVHDVAGLVRYAIREGLITP